MGKFYVEPRACFTPQGSRDASPIRRRHGTKLGSTTAQKADLGLPDVSNSSG